MRFSERILEDSSSAFSPSLPLLLLHDPFAFDIAMNPSLLSLLSAFDLLRVHMNGSTATPLRFIFLQKSEELLLPHVLMIGIAFFFQPSSPTMNAAFCSGIYQWKTHGRCGLYRTV
jgi:hypothetical protein